MSNKSHLITAR